MKKLFIISFLLWLVPALCCDAAGLSTYVDLSLNSTFGSFKKGQKIVFSASTTGYVDSSLVMYVLENGIKVMEKDVVITPRSTPIYKCAYKRPVSVVVELRRKDHPGSDCLSAGAVVAPEEFRPGFDEPADFMEWWGSQIKKVREFKSEPVLTPIDLGKDGRYFVAYDLEVAMPEGNPVRAIVGYPRNAASGTLPLVMTLKSAGVSKEANRSSVKQVLNFARRGAICIDVNAHGMLNHEPQEYYDRLDKGELKDYQKRVLTTREDYYFRLMILRLVKAADYACSLPQWDGRRFVVSGGSQGGYQALAVAALDHRVSFARIGIPAHTDLAAPLYNAHNPWPRCYDQSVKETPELTERILPYYDGANFIRHIGCTLRMNIGLVDKLSPSYCDWAAFNVCPSTDKKMYQYPYMGHGNIASQKRKEEHKTLITRERDEEFYNYLK